MPFLFEAAKLRTTKDALVPKMTKAGNTDTIMEIKYELLSAFSRYVVARENIMSNVLGKWLLFLYSLRLRQGKISLYD